MDSGTLIVLKHFASVTEAEMAREALAAAGIPAAIQNLRAPIDAVSQSVELLVSGSDRKTVASPLN